MSASEATPAAPGPSTEVAARRRLQGRSPRRSLRVLLYSDDATTRDAVRLGVGRRPARDVEIAAWHECATPAAVVTAVENERFDVLVLDGEASPLGGLGLCRQLKSEIYRCPPVLVLIGRVQDGWLAAWSQADLVVPHPLDPVALSRAVARLARAGAPAAHDG